MDLTNFTFTTDKHGIALISWDCPSKSMNVIDLSTLEEFESLIEQIESDKKIKGVVLTSSKKDFGAGADLALIESMIDLYEETKQKEGIESAASLLMAEASRLSRALRRIELMEKPWIAALNGLAMGGCLEMALACHVRLSADDESIKFALPEVKVGLLPGGGGTQRLSRLVNPQDAVQMLLQGRNIKAAKAVELGFIDELVPKDNLVSRAKELILSGCRTKARWDEDKFKAPLRLWTPLGMQMMSAGNALLRKETYANYPAAINIMRCVYEGLQLPFDLALKVEIRYFVNCLTTPEARAMIRTLFKTMQELNKGSKRPKSEKRDLTKIAVLGAGFMGSGIAHVSAMAGLKVLLLDSDLQSAQKGKDRIAEQLTQAVTKKRIDEKSKETILSLIDPIDDYTSINSCDLIIEAVFEDKNVKSEVIKKACASMASQAILASNTSTIPITDLAEYSDTPKDFIGLHFFSPVDRMMLVEIIKGDKTSDTAVAVAMDYVMKIRKTPIVVQDCRGFYVNRCVIRYLNEAWTMLTEGIPLAMIDNIARSIGMPVGPLQLNDEVALDLSQKIIKQTISDLGEQSVESHHVDLIDWMVSEGSIGKKAGKGFYEYPDKHPDKHLWQGLRDRYPQQDANDVSHQDLKDRYLYTIALEAARVVEEKVCDIEEADLGAILGFGFAPWSGGPLSYIDRVGAKKFKERADELSKSYGTHFAPNALIVEMAKTNKKFYESKSQ